MGNTVGGFSGLLAQYLPTYLLHFGSHCAPDSTKDQSLAWHRRGLNNVCYLGSCHGTFDRGQIKRSADMGVPGSVDRIHCCVPFCGFVSG